MRFLMDFWEVAYYAVNENYMALCDHYMVALTLEFGTSKESAFGYVIYGASLAQQKRFEEAFQIRILNLEGI